MDQNISSQKYKSKRIKVSKGTQLSYMVQVPKLAGHMHTTCKTKDLT